MIPPLKEKAMLSASKSDSPIWFPQSEVEVSRVGEQLERLIAHPLFHHSKRYPALLRYVIEQTLAGNADSLKERTIGIEVFGRDPGYDVTIDPVVRVTAAEIRKRLAQYYFDVAHAGEMQFELPTGSYVPLFHPVAAETSSAPPVVAVSSKKNPIAGRGPERFLPRIESMRWIVIGTALLLAATGIFLGYGHFWKKISASSIVPSMIGQFWAPVLSSTGPATICIGEPGVNGTADVNAAKPPAANSLQEQQRGAGRLVLEDVISVTRIAANLNELHKPFRLTTGTQATFNQLREGPVILIGALDNPWTMRLTQSLRYGFGWDEEDGVAEIVDHKTGRPTPWRLPFKESYQKLASDYAVVARYRDPVTGQFTVIAAGLASEGTEAAGEIFSDPNYLAALLHEAPKNWQQMNLEAVIETQVIGGHPGPPKILATEYW